ncbi:MAG: hypothetical protein PHS80_08485 [Methanothrix sp.]|nr:hypothetical protein [Methanothrix sp.]MDD4448007.1 hypothetical protein [Methanothrix sp.]
MAFNESECLYVAKYLVGEQYGPCSLEASQRAAVSRAYFAAFIYVRNYAIDNYDFKPKNNAEDHKRLKNHLIDNGETAIAGDLQDLSIRRGACDYDKIVLGTENSKKQMVSDTIKLSEDIIKTLK